MSSDGTPEGSMAQIIIQKASLFAPPKEVQLHVTDYLDISGLYKLKDSCHHFRAMVIDDHLRRALLKYEEHSSEAEKTIWGRLPCYSCLRIREPGDHYDEGCEEG